MNDLLRRMLFLPEQASTMATHVDYLHYFVIITTMVVSTAIGIATIAFYVKYRWRCRIGAKGEPVHTTFSGELLIVGVPAFFFLFWFLIGFRDFVRMTTPPANAMDVYVMGKQWMWKFAYPEGPSGVNVLRVPANRPVRLLMTSRDVIHSFFVPAFRIKKDVLPGRYTDTWFEATTPGVYPVFCTEMCGTGHSTMRAEVVVMEPREFDRWLTEQRQVARPQQKDGVKTRLEEREPQATMAAMGRQLSESAGCFKCHTTDGTSHIGPTWLDMYMKMETMQDGSLQLVDDAYITESMMAPAAKQVKGFALTMPSYLGRLEGPESAAIVEYIKSLRSDHATDANAGRGSTLLRTGGAER